MRLGVKVRRAAALGALLLGLSAGLVAAAPRELEVSPGQLRTLVQDALYWEAVCGGLMPVTTFDEDHNPIIVCREPSGGWVPITESEWWDDYLRIMRGG